MQILARQVVCLHISSFSRKQIFVVLMDTVKDNISS